MNGAGCLVLTALLLLPTVAGAEPSAGVLSTAAGFHVDPGAAGSGDVLASFWRNASGIRAFSAEAARLRVDVFEFDGPSVGVPGASLLQHNANNHSRSFELTNASVRLAHRATGGWIGDYGRGPTGIDAGGIDLVPASAPLGNTRDATNGASNGPSPFFVFAPDAAYVLLTGPVRVEREGPFSLKVHGPTLRVSGAENDTELWTGSRPSERLPGMTTMRWMLLTATDGHLAVDSDLSTQMAFSRAALDMEGSLRARKASGLMEAPDGSYVAADEDATLTGAFHLDVRAQGTRSAPTLEASVEGRIETTTLAFSRAPAPLQGDRGLWGAALVVAGVALAAVVTARLAHARRGRMSTEQIVDLAYSAADEGRYGDALEWVQQARRRAPESERLRLDEAAFHAELGDVATAIAIYEEVARTSATGEADYLVASLLLQTGAGVDDARPRLLQALRKTPYLALEVVDGPAFEPMRHDPEALRGVSDALRRLDAGGAER